MNQILSVEMPQNKQKSYKNKANIKSVIIFFCIILIIFALVAAIIGVYTMTNKEKEPDESNLVITGTEPKINVEIKSETTLNIIVSHDKQISSIAYGWNDEGKIEEKDIGETNKEIEVEIPVGTNTLNVIAIDINGEKGIYSREYTGTQGPSFVLKEEEGKIKVTAQSDVEIAYISYHWDDGEEKQIQINDVKTEQLLEVPEGEHTLYIVLVDKNGGEHQDKKTIKGDNKPTLNITTDKVNLFVEASDYEGLTKMTVEVYGTGQTKEIEINDKQFNTEIPLQNGDNKLIITVYNVNGIKNEQRVRVVK